MSFQAFLDLLGQYPMLWVMTILTLGVILVNGWTDAPNAIASCVATRAMTPRAAILMAAVFNFLGVFIMTKISPQVAQTISKMVDFGDNAGDAAIGLSAGMVAIVIWAVAAWVFGIPTSESHALIAGLTGSAIAMHGNLNGVNGGEWVKVLYGIIVSLGIGLALSFGVAKLLQLICARMDYRKTNKFFRWGQIGASAGMAFMHGAQDGQKFMGVFLLATSLSQGQMMEGKVEVDLWLMILISVVMGIGTSIGGKKIIKSVGLDMVKLDGYQGFAADLTSTGGLLACQVLGLPVSTTHVKTTAIMGVGAARRVRSVNWSVAKEMVMTWVITFPGCGLISFLITKLFLFIF